MRKRGSKSSKEATKALQKDGLSAMLGLREPILVPSPPSPPPSTASTASSATGGVSDKDDAALTAKNHRLAKELSEVRVRHREECKNVTRLTMENMNLASRCREAITQAAVMKKELGLQKRKTAEAVAQTHQLLDQLKKFKQLERAKTAAAAVAASPAATSILPSGVVGDRPTDEASKINPSNNVAAVEARAVIDAVSAPVGAAAAVDIVPLVSSLETPLKERGDGDTFWVPVTAVVEPVNVDEPKESNPANFPLAGTENPPIRIVSAKVQADPSPLIAAKPDTDESRAGLVDLDESLLSESSNPNEEKNNSPLDATLEEEDGSEHKEADVSSKKVVVLTSGIYQPDEKLDAPIASSKMGLVSSDDYEHSLDEIDGDDENGGANCALPTVSSEPMPAQDFVVAATEPANDLASTDTLEREKVENILAIETFNLDADGRSTTQADATPMKATTVADLLIVNTEKESKDSWLEDYDEAAETEDTLMSLIEKSPVKNDSFPNSVTPKGARYSLSDSYDEEFPPDMIHQPAFSSSRRSKKNPGNVRRESLEEISPHKSLTRRQLEDARSSNNLLSSIDAFEASFRTSFPESFSPKDEAAPATSPSAAEHTPSDVSIYDPFQSSSPTKASPSPSDDCSMSGSGESGKKMGGSDPGTNWGSGIRERATAAFQRHSRRVGLVADPPGTDQSTSPGTSNLSAKRVVPVSLSARLYEAKAIADTPKDHSARWLNEIRASTENESGNGPKASTRTNGVSAVTQLLDAAVTPSALFISPPRLAAEPSLPSAPNVPPTTHATIRNKKVMPISTDATEIKQPPPIHCTPPIEGNMPVFRQFSRLAYSSSSSSSSSQPIASEATRDKYDMNRYSTPIPVADTLKPHIEVGQGERGHDSARARYEKALSQRSGGSNSSSGSANGDIRPHRKGSGSRRIVDDAQPVFTAPPVVAQPERARLRVNVRERAAIFTSPSASSSSRGGGGGRVVTGRSTSGIATTTIDHDDEDIPMRTSLSPRKLRNDHDVSAKPSASPPSAQDDGAGGGMKAVALRSWRQREMMMAAQEPGDHISGAGRVKAIVFDDGGDDNDDGSGIAGRGRRRRHINLSGGGLVRQADRGGGASPVRGGGGREV